MASTLTHASPVKENYKIFNYVEKHKQDFATAIKLYKQTHQVEFSVTDHWVKVGGEVINGINRAEMEKIMKEVDCGVENEEKVD